MATEPRMDAQLDVHSLKLQGGAETVPGPSPSTLLDQGQPIAAELQVQNDTIGAELCGSAVQQLVR